MGLMDFISDLFKFEKNTITVFSDFDGTIVKEQSGVILIKNYIFESKRSFFHRFKAGLICLFEYLFSRKVKYFLRFISDLDKDVIKKTSDSLHLNHGWFDDIETIKKEHNASKINLVILSRNIDLVILEFVKRNKIAFDLHDVCVKKIIANHLDLKSGIDVFSISSKKNLRKEIFVENDNKFEFFPKKTNASQRKIIYIGDKDDLYLKLYVLEYFNAQD